MASVIVRKLGCGNMNRFEAFSVSVWGLAVTGVLGALGVVVVELVVELLVVRVVDGVVLGARGTPTLTTADTYIK